MQARGRGARIRFATAQSPLGRTLVARTDAGICAVAFGDADAELAQALRERFPEAKIAAAPGGLPEEVAAVLAHLGGQPPAQVPALDLPGTPFQREAWALMQAIPRGTTITYGELAARLGRPRGGVPAGGTCAANPVAVFIPCHRIVARDGGLHHWRWGADRKRQLLALERRQAGLPESPGEPPAPAQPGAPRAQGTLQLTAG